MALVSTLTEKLTTTKYDRLSGIRGYPMEMGALAGQLNITNDHDRVFFSTTSLTLSLLNMGH